MPKTQMLINVVAGEECRIAIIADGKLEELYQERASAESHVGNIYKGRVTNVEPSIQAAFVDFGQDRNGFLHISDLHPMYFAGHDKDETEMVGQKTPRRDRPPIQKCLRRGQEILVQVLKEGIGTKGPTLTSYLSIPGRYLVMMPSMERLGVSRKVEDDDARREMRRILDELKPPSGFGFIIRTAGIGKNKTELKRDLAYLQRLWSSIEQRKKHVNVGELFAESDLVVRTIRDIFSTDIEQIIVDDESAAKRARDFLAIANPRTSSKVALYNDPIPLFHRFDIERQIETISSRTVPLPSGGSLVIDSTEALVAIDVNSGKMRDARDAEGTAFKANMEAADEICRQLRLRDLGGVIVSDLIDMRDLRHRKQVETRFRDNLKRDRARTRTSPISQFGILEMTRQRMRPSLRKSIYIDCPHCEGAAQVKSPESVVLDVTRRLALVMHRNNVARVELTVGPAVAFALLNKKRAQMVALESRHDKTILVRVNDAGSSDFVSLLAFDERGSQVEGESLANMGTYELVPVEAVKGKVIVNRQEAEPMGAGDENSDFDTSTRSRNGHNNDAADESNVEQDYDSIDGDQHDHDDNEMNDDSQDSHDSQGSEGDHDDQGNQDNQDEQDAEQGGKKRRRRRRRGGRGRNKRTNESADSQADGQSDEQSDEQSDDRADDRAVSDSDSSQNSDDQSRRQFNDDQDRNAEDQDRDDRDDRDGQDGRGHQDNRSDSDSRRQQQDARAQASDSSDATTGDDQTTTDDNAEVIQHASPKGGAQLAGLSKKLQQSQPSTPDNGDQSDQSDQVNQLEQRDQSNQSEERDSQSEPTEESHDQSSPEGDDDSQDAQGDGLKKRRRRRRGGRRRSGSGSGNENDAQDNEGQSESGQVTQSQPTRSSQSGQSTQSGQASQPAQPSQADQQAQQAKQDKQDKQGKRQTGGRRSSAKSQKASDSAPTSEPAVSRGYHNPALKPSGSSDQA